MFLRIQKAMTIQKSARIKMGRMKGLGSPRPRMATRA